MEQMNEVNGLGEAKSKTVNSLDKNKQKENKMQEK